MQVRLHASQPRVSLHGSQQHAMGRYRNSLRVMPFGRNIIDPDELPETKGTEQMRGIREDDKQVLSLSIPSDSDANSIFFSHNSLARAPRLEAPTVSLPPPPEPEVTLVTKLHTQPNPEPNQVFWGDFINKYVGMLQIIHSERICVSSRLTHGI